MKSNLSYSVLQSMNLKDAELQPCTQQELDKIASSCLIVGSVLMLLKRFGSKS